MRCLSILTFSRFGNFFKAFGAVCRPAGGAACLTSFLPNVTISNVSVTDKEKKN